MKYEYLVEKDENIRLDVYLTAELGLTRSQIKLLIDGAKATVNGLECKCGKILKTNDVVEVETTDEYASDLVPKNIPLDILYEDSQIIVINKQQGLTVHPAAGNYTDTLVNALLYHYGQLSDVNGSLRTGIVHRLDKDTSGVMVVAKTNEAHLDLSRQIAERDVKKVYRAILEGNLKEDKKIITTFIGRNPKDRKTMAVTDEGRIAITEYKVLERFKNYCHTEFLLHTGRTHQIRVHAKYLGHPIVGDTVYGFEKQKFSFLKGQALHSYKLSIKHPVTRETMTFTAPFPQNFNLLLDLISKEV